MDLGLIEELLKNKFVLQKRYMNKFDVVKLGSPLDNPVVLEENDGVYTMYRYRVSFMERFQFKKFNIAHFIDCYYKLANIDIDNELRIRSLCFSGYSVGTLLRNSNNSVLLGDPVFRARLDYLYKIRGELITYILNMIEDENYIVSPDYPTEYKAFVKNSSFWWFKSSMPEMAFNCLKTHLKIRLLNTYINMQKVKGVTYEFF